MSRTGAAACAVRRLPPPAAACGRDFPILSGDDSLTLAVYAHGGDGVISVASNVTPKLVAELCESAASGDFARAREVEEFRKQP